MSDAQMLSKSYLTAQLPLQVITAPAFIGDGSQLTNLPTPTVNYGDITNVPIGFNVNGTGIQSISNNASGFDAFAIGDLTLASGYNSTAMGYLQQQVEIGQLLWVNLQTASGQNSTATGYITVASGIVSTTMGDGNKSKCVCFNGYG